MLKLAPPVESEAKHGLGHQVTRLKSGYVVTSAIELAPSLMLFVLWVFGREPA